MVTFDFCALHYLNQWIKSEERFHVDFNSGDINIRSKTLSEAMHFFKVSRNAPKKYDIEKKALRYEPVIKIIDGISRSYFVGNIVEKIESIEADISKKYGEVGMLSFTTKVLWLKIKSPIIIYDSKVRSVLKTDAEDLRSYYKAWKNSYKKHKKAIDDACIKLPRVQSYCANQDVATQAYIKQVASEEWFKHRILDIYLWHGGIA